MASQALRDHSYFYFILGAGVAVLTASAISGAGPGEGTGSLDELIRSIWRTDSDREAVSRKVFVPYRDSCANPCSAVIPPSELLFFTRHQLAFPWPAGEGVFSFRCAQT